MSDIETTELATPKNIRAHLFQELEHEIQFYSLSTQRQYRANVSDYLDWLKARKQVERWAEREVLYAYIAHLQKGRHLKQPAVNYIIRGAIGCLFRMSGLRLPVKLPKVTAPMLDVASRKSFTKDEIETLIITARASGDKRWANMIALSSIYGLRAGEIRSLSKTDIHIVKKTIVVQTLKGGMIREHMVPSQIAPFIFNYDYPEMKPQAVFDVFNAIAAAAGVEKGVDHKGLHAVRHGVMTTMEDMRDSNDNRVYDQNDLYRFFRWKGGGMLQIYVTPQMPDVDQRIFKHHPFLKLWEI